jgi:hypothetical protein
MQQFWIWDVTVVTKRCAVLILDSQRHKENVSFEQNNIRGLVIFTTFSQYKDFWLVIPF